MPPPSGVMHAFDVSRTAEWTFADKELQPHIEEKTNKIFFNLINNAPYYWETLTGRGKVDTFLVVRTSPAQRWTVHNIGFKKERKQ